MNWLDILIIVTLAASVIGGLSTGLVRGLCNLAGLIIGIFVAGKYYENLGGKLTIIHNADIAKVVAFIMIIAGLIGTLLHKILSGIMLGGLDRLLGAVVGLVVGAVLWGALLALWAKYFSAGAVSGSFMAKILLENFPLVLNLLPSSFAGVKNFFK
jgi:membrane protein required for colicin V production